MCWVNVKSHLSCLCASTVTSIAVIPNRSSLGAYACGPSSICSFLFDIHPLHWEPSHSISGQVLLIQQCFSRLHHIPTVITLVLIFITSFLNYCNCLLSDLSASSLSPLTSFYSWPAESFSQSTAVIISFSGLENINGFLMPANKSKPLGRFSIICSSCVFANFCFTFALYISHIQSQPCSLPYPEFSCRFSHLDLLACSFPHLYLLI